MNIHVYILCMYVLSLRIIKDNRYFEQGYMHVCAFLYVISNFDLELECRRVIMYHVCMMHIIVYYVSCYVCVLYVVMYVMILQQQILMLLLPETN
jgi:hypothetical protein